VRQAKARKHRNTSTKTEIYPHAIVHDFEAYLDKTKSYNPTKDLTYDNTHIPTSVSVGDTLLSAPIHLCKADPKALTKAFASVLERRAAVLRAEVEKQYLPADIDLLPQGQRQEIRTWCEHVSVLGFNSGRYDLNLIKDHFVEQLADTC
jgi:hypothetical protein